MKKGEISLWILAVALIGLAVYGGFSLSDSQTESLQLEPISCPIGQIPKLVQDEAKCGSSIQGGRISYSGACLEFVCPITIGADNKVDHCEVALTYVANTPPSASLKRIEPGQRFYDANACSNALAGQSVWVYSNIYVKFINQCEICVPSGIQNECNIGDLKCGTGSEQQGCTVPSGDKPYNHWVTIAYCPSGTCIKEGGSLTCNVPCTSDYQCKQTEFCDLSRNKCITQLPNGATCDRDIQCLNEYCSQTRANDVFGGLIPRVCANPPIELPNNAVCKEDKDCASGTCKNQESTGLLGKVCMAESSGDEDCGINPACYIGKAFQGIIICRPLLPENLTPTFSTP